jgi:hypothetical protein
VVDLDVDVNVERDDVPRTLMPQDCMYRMYGLILSICPSSCVCPVWNRQYPSPPRVIYPDPDPYSPSPAFNLIPPSLTSLTVLP